MSNKNPDELSPERRAFIERLHKLLDTVLVETYTDRKTGEKIEVAFPRYGRQKRFARDIGLSSTGAGMVLKRGLGSEETKKRIADKYGCRVVWLMFGLGPMMKFEVTRDSKMMARISAAVDTAAPELSARKRAALAVKLYEQLIGD